jgi:hypothetical protein
LLSALVLLAVAETRPKAAKWLLYVVVVIPFGVGCVVVATAITYNTVLPGLLSAMEFLFDPRFIYVAVPIFAVIWFMCRRSPFRVIQVIAETIQPWLIGMTIVAVSFFAVSRWLPRADWSWVFFAESTASWCEVHIEKFLPEGVAMNLALLVIFFAINLLGPKWKKWTKQSRQLIDLAKSATAVLGVVTSFTFFGSAQAGFIKEQTAQEKYNRLLDQTTARADLILAARISEHADIESTDITQFLNSVYQGVSLDLQIYPTADDYQRSGGGDLTPDAFRKLELQQLLQRRVAELRAAMKASRSTRRLSEQLDTFIVSTLQRYLSDEEIADARDKFTSALDAFVDSGAQLSTQSISVMLTVAGLPDEVPQAVKDLYTSEVSEFAKKLTDPLANSLFKPVPTADTAAKIADIADQPIFDAGSLASAVVNPTLQDRKLELDKEKELSRVAPGVEEEEIRDVP